MWRPDGRYTSELDDIASEFLRGHGVEIPAEPLSQTFRWSRQTTTFRPRAEMYVPLAAFLDVPRVARAAAYARKCDECQARCVGRKCARCQKRKIRADFIDTCREKRGNSLAIFHAMLTEAAWEGAGDDGVCWIAVQPPSIEDDPSRYAEELIDAFEAAMEANAEPEVFREIVVGAGFSSIVEQRDQRLAEMARARAEKARERPKVQPPLVVMPAKEARAEAAKLIANPRFPMGRLWDTRSQWTVRAYIDLQILLKASVPPEDAATALGRSATSIAWRAHDLGFRLPATWRPLLKLSREEARHA